MSKGDLLSLTTVILVSVCAAAQTSGDAWKPVESAMGRAGKLQSDGAYKFGMPRGDLKVTVSGTAIQPGLALGSWAAFDKPSGEAMVMGDLVLTQAEVEPVMLALEKSGISVTALHNHLLNESPRVMYMHLGGRGDPVQLARAIHDALALTATPAPKAAAPPAAPVALDTAQIDQILGHKGSDNGGIHQVGVPRAETIHENGMPVPASMGVATGLNFQPTGKGRAAITGDFVLLGSEVNPVIQALRANGIEVTAVHSHMLDEEPRLFFMHFWANDDALKLARGLRAALDRTNSKK